MREFIGVVLDILATIGSSMSNFNINLSRMFMLENNVFFLGFITTLEIYILCDILFFGKIILKGFIKQGFVITSLIFALAYKADMSTISGAFILLTCLGVFINKGISDYSFTDLFRTIDEGADEYVRLKVSGGLNDLNEP